MPFKTSQTVQIMKSLSTLKPIRARTSGLYSPSTTTPANFRVFESYFQKKYSKRVNISKKQATNYIDYCFLSEILTFPTLIAQSVELKAYMGLTTDQICCIYFRLFFVLISSNCLEAWIKLRAFFSERSEEEMRRRNLDYLFQLVFNFQWRKSQITYFEWIKESTHRHELEIAITRRRRISEEEEEEEEEQEEKKRLKPNKWKNRNRNKNKNDNLSWAKKQHTINIIWQQTHRMQYH